MNIIEQENLQSPNFQTNQSIYTFIPITKNKVSNFEETTISFIGSKFIISSLIKKINSHNRKISLVINNVIYKFSEKVIEQTRNHFFLRIDYIQLNKIFRENLSTKKEYSKNIESIVIKGYLTSSETFSLPFQNYDDEVLILIEFRKKKNVNIWERIQKNMNSNNRSINSSFSVGKIDKIATFVDNFVGNNPQIWSLATKIISTNNQINILFEEIYFFNEIFLSTFFNYNWIDDLFYKSFWQESVARNNDRQKLKKINLLLLSIYENKNGFLKQIWNQLKLFSFNDNDKFFTEFLGKNSFSLNEKLLWKNVLLKKYLVTIHKLFLPLCEINNNNVFAEIKNEVIYKFKKNIFSLKEKKNLLDKSKKNTKRNIEKLINIFELNILVIEDINKISHQNFSGKYSDLLTNNSKNSEIFDEEESGLFFLFTEELSYFINRVVDIQKLISNLNFFLKKEKNEKVNINISYLISSFNKFENANKKICELEIFSVFETIVDNLKSNLSILIQVTTDEYIRNVLISLHNEKKLFNDKSLIERNIVNQEETRIAFFNNCRDNCIVKNFQWNELNIFISYQIKSNEKNLIIKEKNLKKNFVIFIEKLWQNKIFSSKIFGREKFKKIENFVLQKKFLKNQKEIIDSENEKKIQFKFKKENIFFRNVCLQQILNQQEKLQTIDWNLNKRLKFLEAKKGQKIEEEFLKKKQFTCVELQNFKKIKFSHEHKLNNPWLINYNQEITIKETKEKLKPVKKKCQILLDENENKLNKDKHKKQWKREENENYHERENKNLEDLYQKEKKQGRTNLQIFSVLVIVSGIFLTILAMLKKIIQKKIKINNNEVNKKASINLI